MTTACTGTLEISSSDQMTHWIRWLSWFTEWQRSESLSLPKDSLSQHWFTRWMREGRISVITERFTESTLIHLLNESVANLCHYQKIHRVNTDSLTKWEHSESLSLPKDSLSQHWFKEQISVMNKMIHILIQTLAHWMNEEQILVMSEKIHLLKHWFTEQVRTKSLS